MTSATGFLCAPEPADRDQAVAAAVRAQCAANARVSRADDERHARPSGRSPARHAWRTPRRPWPWSSIATRWRADWHAVRAALRARKASCARWSLLPLRSRSPRTLKVLCRRLGRRESQCIRVRLAIFRPALCDKDDRTVSARGRSGGECSRRTFLHGWPGSLSCRCRRPNLSRPQWELTTCSTHLVARVLALAADVVLGVDEQAVVVQQRLARRGCTRRSIVARLIVLRRSVRLRMCDLRRRVALRRLPTVRWSLAEARLLRREVRAVPEWILWRRQVRRAWPRTAAAAAAACSCRLRL